MALAVFAENIPSATVSIRKIIMNLSLPVEERLILLSEMYAAGDHFFFPMRYISLMKYG